MPRKLIGNLSIEQNLNSTLLIIPSKKNWQIPFIGAWLVFWLFGPFHDVLNAWKSLPHPDSGTWFMLLWSVGWLFGIVFASSTLLWSLGGRDVVRLTPDEIELTRTIFGFVIKKRTTPTDQVKNLRYMPGNSGPFRGRPGRICYEDDRGTVEFGSGFGFTTIGLKDAEALAVIEEMLLVYPFRKRDRAFEYIQINN